MTSALAAEVTAGSVRAAARACRLVDDALPGHIELLKALFPRTGRAWIVGVTGNPGSGKSTLVDGLIEVFRKQAMRVAVVAGRPPRAGLPISASAWQLLIRKPRCADSRR